MTKHPRMTSIGLGLMIVTLTFSSVIEAKECKAGENELVDQILTCSQAKLFDLDLTPQGDYVKSTARTLVEQGLSNRTTIIYAKIGGMWSIKRPSFADTHWTCSANTTSANAVVQFTGLSLEVIERVDIPLHRSQSKLAIHKPCKTFDLPLWMCRQSKPVFRTTKTWVNQAYFNLTLVQSSDRNKPSIYGLNPIFTCPETFKQKITYSPSAMYIISKFAHTDGKQYANPQPQHETSSPKYRLERRSIRNNEVPRQADGSVVHSSSYTGTQDGRGPATPPYHNSVNLIMNQVSESLRSAISDCNQILDSDLFLFDDYNSSQEVRSSKLSRVGQYQAEHHPQEDKNECSNKEWLTKRLDLANQAASMKLNGEQHQDESHHKRSQFYLKYPVDPNQLLNPYGYYHENADQMIEDS